MGESEHEPSFREACVCGSKIRHETRKSAKDASQVLKRKFPETPVSIYKCQYCHYWHIGRDRK